MKVFLDKKSNPLISLPKYITLRKEQGHRGLGTSVIKITAFK
jgi:hypothetical protein